MTAGLGLAGLAGLVGFVLVGSVVPVLPTGAAVSATAVLARTQHPWELAAVVLAGGLGAYLGDLVVYAALRRAGAPLAQRVGWLHADDPDGALQHLRAGIEANERKALLLSRLLPGGRIPVLLAASLGGYPWRRLAGANVAAALLWATMYAAIGVVGDTVLPGTRTAVVVVVVVALLVGFVPGLVRRRRATSVDDADTAADTAADTGGSGLRAGPRP